MGQLQSLEKCEHRVHENGAFNSEQAMDLLMWKDVTKSGIAFGTATFLYLLFELSGWTTVAILANAALLAIIGTFVWSTVSQVLGKSEPRREKRGGVGHSCLSTTAATEA